MNEYAGTRHYMPPEMRGENKKYRPKNVDIWCLGVVFFEMVTLGEPFKTKSDFLNYQYEEEKVKNTQLSALFRKIFVKSSNRITIGEICYDL